MNKLDNFEPIYVINLKNRTDRRSYMLDLFQKNNITNFEFIDAFDGSSVAGSYVMTPGEIGCTMSHLIAIKHFFDNSDYDSCIIAEDDLSFDAVKYWNWTWKEFVDSVTVEYDILHVCSIEVDPPDLKLHKRHYDNTDILTTVYLITRAGAKKIIDKYFNGDTPEFDFNYKGNVADHEILYDSVNTYSIALLTPNNNLASSINSTEITDYLFKMSEANINNLKQNKLSVSEIAQLRD